jgi:MarR family transcriptional regulator, transcriptional regulator for hemolysin
MGLGHDPNKESVGRLLVLTAKTAREVLDARLQAAGASHAAWLVLHALINHQAEGSSQRALADHLWIEGPTMTRHLDRLEAGGLIERRPDPQDRRNTLVHSTPEGKRVLVRLTAIMEKAQEDILAGLTPSEIDTLTKLMQRVRDNVERAAERESVPITRHRHGAPNATEKEGAANVR